MIQSVEAGVNEALRTWDCKRPNGEETAYKSSGQHILAKLGVHTQAQAVAAAPDGLV
jgi:hypothetical protein